MWPFRNKKKETHPDEYKEKYFALKNQIDEANHNAFMVLGKYEALCASLPLNHELSTRFHWQEYADKKILNENKALHAKVKKLSDSNRELMIAFNEKLNAPSEGAE